MTVLLPPGPGQTALQVEATSIHFHYNELYLHCLTVVRNITNTLVPLSARRTKNIGAELPYAACLSCAPSNISKNILNSFIDECVKVCLLATH